MHVKKREAVIQPCKSPVISLILRTHLHLRPYRCELKTPFKMHNNNLSVSIDLPIVKSFQYFI